MALFVSVVLVGGASWSRFAGAEKPVSDLLTVEERAASNDYYDKLFLDSLEATATTSAASQEPLTGTDLIGRQLILDYVDMATKGQATAANITALADRYIESIPTLNQAQTISYTELKTVSDTKANFQNYADELTKIYGTYATQISLARSRGGNLDTLNPAFYAFTLAFSAAYTEVAGKLKNLPVPATLASTHLQLINNYLSSAAAMKAISETEQDSARAFAGLIAMNENVEKELAILREIERILISNGI